MSKQTLTALVKQHKLTLNQTAKALGVSPATIESACAKNEFRYRGWSSRYLVWAIERYVQQPNIALDNNLIFGHYKLGVARTILQLSIAEMAQRYDYTTFSWQKLESDSRPINKQVLEAIEHDVCQKFIEIGMFTKPPV